MRSSAVSCYGGVGLSVVQKMLKYKQMLTASKKGHLAGAGVRQQGMAYRGIALGLGDNLHL